MTDFVDRPEPGFWLIRLVKRGPYVPARIYWSEGIDPDTGESIDRPRLLCGEVAGEPCDPFDIWLTRRKPIDEKDFRFRTDEIRWLRQNKPDTPQCHPRRPIDFTNLPPIAELAE